MSQKLPPTLLLLLLSLLLHLPSTHCAPSVSTLRPSTHRTLQQGDPLSPALHLYPDALDKAEEDDDFTAPTTFRRVFATPRVFNIIVRYRRFAALALNADPETTGQIRDALSSCLATVRALQSDDNVRNVRTLLSALVLLLDWLMCLLN